MQDAGRKVRDACHVLVFALVFTLSPMSEDEGKDEGKDEGPGGSVLSSSPQPGC